jgi:Zn-dependent protease with chaperone function
MFSKPLSLVLVYLLTVVNLMIVFSPLLVVLSPLMLLNQAGFMSGVKDIAYISLLVTSSLMILYLLLDLVFGFSVWSLTKGCKNIKHYRKKYDFISDIEKSFEELKVKFHFRNVKLNISEKEEVNAYAIGSLRSNHVVITTALIMTLHEHSKSYEEFIANLKAILGHEMSHLVNKDFLPGLLLLANDKAINFMNGLVMGVFNFLLRLFHSFPFIGSLITSVLRLLYSFSSGFIQFFYKYIFLKIYEFIKLHVSRSNEYRCDRESSLACGGKNMALALSCFGDSGYVSLFSTHPRTKNRIKHVAHIKQKNGAIHHSIIAKLSNSLAILLLFVVLLFTIEQVDKSQISFLKKNQLYNKFLHYKNSFEQKLERLKK